MARVVVPGGRDPLAFVWGDLAPALSGPAAAYSSAVYERSSLSLREFESARITIAGINQCVLCLGWRTARDVPGRSTDPAAVPDSFYDDVVAHRWDSLSARERLAAEFAERYASDHLGMDDDLWVRLHARVQRRRARRPRTVRGLMAGPRPFQPGLRHRRCLPGSVTRSLITERRRGEARLPVVG